MVTLALAILFLDQLEESETFWNKNSSNPRLKITTTAPKGSSMLSFVSLILLHPYIFRWNCSSSFCLLISIFEGPSVFRDQMELEIRSIWCTRCARIHRHQLCIFTEPWMAPDGTVKCFARPVDSTSLGSWWWSNSVSSWDPETTANQLMNFILYSGANGC